MDRVDPVWFDTPIATIALMMEIGAQPIRTALLFIIAIILLKDE
jgi:hypothetical protein